MTLGNGYFFICCVLTYLSTLRPNKEYGIDCLVILGGSVEGVIVAAVPDDPPRLASVNLDVIIMRKRVTIQIVKNLPLTLM